MELLAIMAAPAHLAGKVRVALLRVRLPATPVAALRHLALVVLAGLSARLAAMPIPKAVPCLMAALVGLVFLVLGTRAERQLSGPITPGFILLFLYVTLSQWQPFPCFSQVNPALAAAAAQVSLPRTRMLVAVAVVVVVLAVSP